MNQQLDRVRSPISGALVALGAASIAASIGVWATSKGASPEERAHAERFGIFVGLWAPTFFILADFLSRPGGLMSGGAASKGAVQGGAQPSGALSDGVAPAAHPARAERVA